MIVFDISKNKHLCGKDIEEKRTEGKENRRNDYGKIDEHQK